MPVYKGNNEVTSGNLYKGTTEIQDGYKATDPFYVNEVTLVISFVNNTNLSSSSSLTRTIVGVPGNSFSTQQFIVTASSSQRVNSLSFSESGDTQSIATCSTSGVNQNGGNYNVTGTFPTISQTITFTLTASVTNLSSLTAIFSGSPNSITGGSSFSAGTYLVGASNTITCRLTGFSSNSAASAAQSYVSQGQSLQPHSGTWSISDSPSFGTSVNSSNQIVCQANGGDTQYKGTAATTVTFGSAGQSAGYSVSISKASGYYIASSSGSNTYMEYT
jgi:hypothetical protein